MSSFVVLELRLAFKTCAQPRSYPQFRRAFFSTHRHLQKRKDTPVPPTSSKKPAQSLSIARRPDVAPARSQYRPNALPSETPKDSGRYVSPAPRSYRDVETGKQVPVPMKVMPKAQLTPELVLNAKERMQLEFITRNVPKREPGKVFAQRLLIYHRGLSTTNATVFYKAITIVFMVFSVCVGAPAYYTYGAPWWTYAAWLVIGLPPFLLYAWWTRPRVTWIYLILPPFARQSPKAALEYARNLPDAARLQIHYMRASGLPANVEVVMRDLKPARSRYRPVSFEWAGDRVEKGVQYRPNLTQFFVKGEIRHRQREARYHSWHLGTSLQQDRWCGERSCSKMEEMNGILRNLVEYCLQLKTSP